MGTLNYRVLGQLSSLLNPLFTYFFLFFSNIYLFTTFILASNADFYRKIISVIQATMKFKEELCLQWRSFIQYPRYELLLHPNEHHSSFFKKMSVYNSAIGVNWHVFFFLLWQVVAFHNHTSVTALYLFIRKESIAADVNNKFRYRLCVVFVCKVVSRGCYSLLVSSPFSFFLWQ